MTNKAKELRKAIVAAQKNVKLLQRLLAKIERPETPCLDDVPAACGRNSCGGNCDTCDERR